MTRKTRLAALALILAGIVVSVWLYRREKALVRQEPISAWTDDHRADCAGLFHGIVELRCRLLRVREWQGGKEREARRIARAQLCHALIEISMPPDGLRLRHAMREDVRPGRQDLVIDPLSIHRRGALLDRLDAIVCEAGGRIYPAKDARMSVETFRRGYPRLEEFRKFVDPRLGSSFARRVMGTA